MKIYHGTSHSIARKAASQGLSPQQFDLPLNLKTECTISNSDMVYLSTTYALCSAYASDETQIAIIEIETDRLDKKRFYPDEDFVYEFLKRRNSYFHANNHGLYDYIRGNPHIFQEYWSGSLQMLGGICYKGLVPANAITRYLVFDLELFDSTLANSMMYPIVCVTNHSVIGWFYKQFIAWSFDEVKELPHVKEALDVLSNIEDKKSDMAIHFEGQVELFKRLQKKRDGIKIVNL